MCTEAYGPRPHVAWASCALPHHLDPWRPREVACRPMVGPCPSLERGVHIAAHRVLGDRAPRMEPTAGREVYGAREIAGDGHGVRAPARDEPGDGAYERLRVGVPRVREQLLGGRRFDDAPEVHDGDPLARVAHD